MKSRFVIINETDAPCTRNLAEWIEGVGYCYMYRAVDKYMKEFDGMTPTSPTPIEKFGFNVEIWNNFAVFTRIAESLASYSDGVNRKWQDPKGKIGTSFQIPLVIGLKKPRKTSKTPRHEVSK